MSTDVESTTRARLDIAATLAFDLIRDAATDVESAHEIARRRPATSFVSERVAGLDASLGAGTRFFFAYETFPAKTV